MSLLHQVLRDIDQRRGDAAAQLPPSLRDSVPAVASPSRQSLWLLPVALVPVLALIWVAQPQRLLPVEDAVVVVPAAETASSPVVQPDIQPETQAVTASINEPVPVTVPAALPEPAAEPEPSSEPAVAVIPPAAPPVVTPEPVAVVT